MQTYILLAIAAVTISLFIHQFLQKYIKGEFVELRQSTYMKLKVLKVNRQKMKVYLKVLTEIQGTLKSFFTASFIIILINTVILLFQVYNLFV